MIFNPGQFFEEVAEFYDPTAGEEGRLFMKAKLGKNFDVWDPKNKILFHRNSPLGKHTIADVVSSFCQVLEMDHRTNHSVRGDCIQVFILFPKSKCFIFSICFRHLSL